MTRIISSATRSRLRAKEIDDPLLRSSYDGLVFNNQNWALEKLLVLHEDIDDGFGVIDIVIGIEFELLELGILADEVFDRIFENVHNLRECRGIGRSFDINDDFVIHSEFLGDRQGVRG